MACNYSALQTTLHIVQEVKSKMKISSAIMSSIINDNCINLKRKKKWKNFREVGNYLQGILELHLQEFGLYKKTKLIIW